MTGTADPSATFAAPRIVLFDDAEADAWSPFSLTRPCGELLFGRWTAAERVELASSGSRIGHLSRPWLARFGPPRVHADAPGQDRSGAAAGGAVCYWNSRAIPLLADSPSSRGWPNRPANLFVSGAFAGFQAQICDSEPPSPEWIACAEPLSGLPRVDLNGRWLRQPWELVSGAADQLAEDLLLRIVRIGTKEGRQVPDGCHQLGHHPVLLGSDVTIEPGVLFDTREGPIELGTGVEVRSGTRLVGPLWAGKQSRLLGGSITRLAADTHTYLRGEVEDVTTLGYMNKAHDGFLGHAYAGRWVNLGAATTNSDLKNTYGPVRVGPPEARVDTGITKLGCLLGDHVKTGIGTLIPTGSVLGAGTVTFPGEVVPTWVPPFSWRTDEERQPHEGAAFIATATKAMQRRGVVDDDLREYLQGIWEAGSTVGATDGG